MVDVQIEAGKRIAGRLRSEARWARQAWALWEALNGGSQDTRSELRESLQYLGLGGQVGFFQGVLVRDTLLALFRISDQKNKDRLTLCAISHLLEDDRLRAKLATKDRFIAEGCTEWLADFEAREQPKRIAVIRSYVPPKWLDQPPKERALYDLRHRLKDTRDKVLAHPLDATGVIQPSVDDIRQFLKLTATLVRNAELVFLGSAHTTDDQYRVHVEEATKLWGLLQEGPIRVYNCDMKARRNAGID